MELTSVGYLAFVFAALVLYYLIPRKSRWLVLLTFSICFFFIVGTPYTFLYLLVSIVVSWFAGIKIGQAANTTRSAGKAWLAVALSVNLGLLAALKYANFFLRNTVGLFNLIFKTNYVCHVNWIAALGISFYTLQLVGYLLDCYWERVEPQKNILKFALFACFFPQMISGPISRYDQLGTELYAEHRFDFENIKEGAVRIAYGVLKKLVIADNLNNVISAFMDPDTVAGLPLLLLLFAYVVQIYMDFSGCMDIVIGTAKCFGIELTENFNRPFSSRSIQEFWQRWHITLGAWLKDYVMYPLLHAKLTSRFTKWTKAHFGKNASKKIPTYAAMLVLWLCMGLWHGGGWTFLMEGLWFWLVIVTGQLLSPLFKRFTSHIHTENKLWVFFQCFRTTVIYLIGAVFFYASSVKEGFRLLASALSPARFLSWIPHDANLSMLKEFFSDHLSEVTALAGALLGFIVFLILNRIDKKHSPLYKRCRKKPAMVCLLIIVIFLYICMILGVWGPGYDASEFIYGGF